MLLLNWIKGSCSLRPIGPRNFDSNQLSINYFPQSVSDRDTDKQTGTGTEKVRERQIERDT